MFIFPEKESAFFFKTNLDPQLTVFPRYFHQLWVAGCFSHLKENNQIKIIYILNSLLLNQIVLNLC